MNPMSRPTTTIAAVLTLLLAAGCSHAAAPALQTFDLKEGIGQTWMHDIVFFPLKQPIDKTRVALLDPHGAEVPYQLSGDEKAQRIAFFADLPADGQSRYQFVRQQPNTASTKLKVERDAAWLRVSNGITGVQVPTAAGRFQDGPLQSLRLKSGAWVGGCRLTAKRAIESYTARIAAQGPVYVDIECRYHFAGGKNWAIDLRVLAGEPVVLIHETFDLDDDSSWEFLAHSNFAPNQALLRAGEDVTHSVVPLQAKEGSVQVQLCPWAAWWDRRNATFFGLFKTPAGTTVVHDADSKRLAINPEAALTGAADDMLIAAAGDVASWARSGPEIYDYGPGKFVPVKAGADGQLAFQLQLAAPGRRWLLGTASVHESLVADDAVTPAQKLMNRFCETPLDSVKDMPLRWQHTAPYPRLVVKTDDVKALVARPDYEKQLALNEHGRALKQLALPLIAGQTTERNQAKIDELKRDIMTKLDAMVEYFRYGNNRRGSAMFGTIIPRVDIGYVLPPVDIALGAGLFTPQEQERVYARLAFVAEKLASPDYESPGRSLAGNPNMVTAWAAARVLLACLLPDHPDARRWYDEGMARLDAMLDKWQGPSGAWLEAPHYQMAAMDPIFLAKIAAWNSGYLEGKTDERLLRTILFLAKISTPPDPRFADRRHFPPIGNTYLMETSLIFAATAKLYRATAPEQAAALQWMWHQQGKPHWLALGGAFTLDYYIELLADEDWNPPAPPWTSEAFPGFGAVLHSGFPGARETYMVYHQGDVSTAHYDHDQGSFELWGKGRPLCLDWGYHGYAPAWQHNRVDSGDAGKVMQFATTGGADYIHGQQTGGWDRQVVLVKDKDALGPTYFVLRDTTTGDGTANWWLWLNARRDADAGPAQATKNDALQPGSKYMEVKGDMVTATGEHDVDLDVWLSPSAHDRGAPEVKELTIATVTGFPNGSWSSWEAGKTTQQGLHLVQPRGEPLVAVLYPRLHEERAPQITALAGSKALKITTERGDDYVFLALDPFEFKDGPVTFSGTVGAIQHRGDNVTLTLPAAGSIAYATASLKSDGAQSQTYAVK